MNSKPLSRIPKNRKTKNNMTEAQMMEKFINEHADIAFKYVLWQETILPNQVFNPDVNVEAIDVELEEVQHYESVLTQEELNELFKDDIITFNDPGDEQPLTGKSNPNYGINN